MSSRRFRDRLPFAPRPERDFAWRSRGASRLESLSDAVFGFALTLLVIANQVPRTFGDLVDALRELPAFIACFSLLMYLWNEHYRFFRRYGLEDLTVRLLNYVILLLVVFSVYPLKFLFTAWFSHLFGPSSWRRAIGSVEELYAVFAIYGVGLAGIYLLYALLFRHALRQRDVLRLNDVELAATHASFAEFAIQVGVCGASVLLAWLRIHPLLPGIVYFALAPLMWLNGRWHERRVQTLRSRRAALGQA